ncbi:DUF2975 domain-containing protein [Flagellimonas algicola]|uniref:DUF2975 domain-containing protein n=1 Tax=Flagellimonas algicola TaxID=2583815 RepID=A0ABY2WKK8_9FLAO|nr:DUF2975 domain-containing protein [Allomuricauda algicola]TMU55361.1 DUF2975 domain-containing protein [Allomuricauda algicola]
MKNNSNNLKVFGPNSLSKYLFYIFRAISIGFLLFIIYIDLSFLLSNVEIINARYYISLPILGVVAKGDYQTNVIVTITLSMLYGTIFFYVLSNIFKAFVSETVFTESAIKHLRYFSFLNLLVGPLLYLVTHFFIMQHSDYRGIHNPILNIIFGVTALFIVHIFKKGYAIQSDNDLTI